MSKRHDYQDGEYSNRMKHARVSNDSEGHNTSVPDVGSFTQGPLDATFGQHAAFPVTQLDEATDPLTDSVQSYLESVRREAEKDQCIYYTHISQNPPPEDNENEAIKDSKEECTIAVESDNNEIWRTELMEEFLRLKADVEIYLQSLRVQPDHSSENQPEAEANTEIPFDIPETATAWRQYIINNPPPSIEFFFLHLNRPTIIKLLIYASKWLSANSNENLSMWIFLLFLRLDSLLDHIDCSIVRDLAKKAIKIKANTNPQDINDVSKYTIDMVIVIVGEYYRQRDLLVY